MGIAALDATSPDAVFDFLDAHVSRRGRGHWAWKYRLDRGPSGRAFYHVGADGAVNGFIGVLPTTLHLAGGALRAGWFVDWASGSGGVGAGVGLLRRAQATVDVLLTLQGSADTRAILPKLRWSHVERPGLWVLPLGTRAVGERVAARAPSWLLGPARAAGAVGAHWFRVSRPGAARWSLEEVERVPASYDEVWAARRSEFVPLMDRSSESLNFMCADYPDGGYRRFLVRDGAAVTGHAMLRADHAGGGVRGRIVDLLWERGRPEMVRWLVQQTAWVLQEEHRADVIECTASVPDLEDALGRCRFSRRRPVPIWYSRLPTEAAPEGWYVTFFDCDRAYR